MPAKDVPVKRQTSMAFLKGNCPKGGNHNLVGSGMPGVSICQKCKKRFKAGKTDRT